LFFFFQAEDGIRDLVRSRGLGDVYKRQGESELSKDEFQKEIKLYGINTYEDGSAEIYYKANDLFWGHEIQTSIDNEQKYESSTIVG